LNPHEARLALIPGVPKAPPTAHPIPSAITPADSPQRAQQPEEAFSPHAERRYRREDATRGGKHSAGARIVRECLREEHTQTNFPKLDPDGDDHHAETTAGNSFRSLLTRPATATSQAPANITIPHTTGNPKVDAAKILEGR
jgi:hypothetical protein